MAQARAAGRRSSIQAAAEELIVQHGVHGWSMEQVAQAAGCAKGLVHYHFGSRAAMLASVAAALGHQRMAGRIRVFALRGTAALDALWQVLRADATAGRSRAWLELGLDGAADIRSAMIPTATELDAFAAASGGALEMPPLEPARARALLFILEGLEAGLVRGALEADVREAYDRIWLAMLG